MGTTRSKGKNDFDQMMPVGLGENHPPLNLGKLAKF